MAEALTTEVLVVLDAARFLIENAYRLLRDEPLPHGSLATKFKSGRLVREPYGVVAIISPWNYPFSIPATETLAALVAGNAVVLKPSEFTSLVALQLQSLLHAAGVPRDIFHVVVGDGATGAALIHSPIDKLVFTGSVATGKRIAAAAAERLLPVVLELGGKDPMLVLDDVDIDVASSAAVWGAFVNAGQACLSVERCYVHRSLYEEFLRACVEKTNKLRVGNGLDLQTDVGPMIHERQLQIVEAHVEDAVARGARLLAGGSRLLALGKNFYKPTVLADVTHEMRIMREETFGPVLPVSAFDSDDEAVRLANDSEFGLAASVWTRSVAARRAAGAAHSGGHSDGERCDFLLWHQRGAARRAEVERLGPHAWTLRSGRDGAAEASGCGPRAENEESLVVRLRSGLRAADGRLSRFRVWSRLGNASARGVTRRRSSGARKVVSRELRVPEYRARPRSSAPRFRSGVGMTGILLRTEN